MKEEIGLLLFGFFTSFGFCIFLLKTKRLHEKFSNDHFIGIQKTHRFVAPRIGGLAIFAGFFACALMLQGNAYEMAKVMWIAGIPAFTFGFVEDITKSIKVLPRLIATVLSGILFVILSGYALNSLQLAGFDYVLSLPIIGVIFTAFAIAGVVNSINLVDGFHGLAIGTLVLASLAFAAVGWRVGDQDFVKISIICVAVFAGFMVVNFPLGRMFLGDGGAYFGGFLVATLAVMLPLRNPEVSPWISLVILAYPVTETLVTMMRRFADSGAKIGQPDRSHLHHLIYLNVVPRLASFTPQSLSKNPMTSLVLLVLPALALLIVLVIGFEFWTAVCALFALCLCYSGLYYFALISKQKLVKSDAQLIGERS